ncbi:MAG: sodium:solute symporter family protein [Saprospiraceae bacterium]|nr:sodium:solute symporter family protein [Saprospiraceae bacterium]
MIALFSWPIDGLIIGIYLCATIAIGLWVRRYVQRVDQYLVAGREVDLYLGIASLAATEFGIVTCMANAELGYKFGFAGATPGIMFMVAMFVVGKTGFCIAPLRKEAVMTIPELFQSKFGMHIRWAAGVVIVLGGLLNMGVFLRQAGDFLTLVMNIDTSYLEVMMTGILLVVAVYTLLGGMLSVLITDYMQFIVMSVGLIATTLLVMFSLGWEPIITHLISSKGASALIPISGEGYSWDRILLDIVIAFAAVLTWQTMIARVLAARSIDTAKKIYQRTSPFFLVRYLLPAFLGIAALLVLAQQEVEPAAAIQALPTFLSLFMPIGLLGILVAGMLAADMSTQSSYMLAWSSVIYNDILYPIHRGTWSERKGMLINRMLVAGIGIFLLLYGLWYPLQGDLWTYMQVTGTIYLASISTILIAACYWPQANDWGALGAIIVGASLPVLYLIGEQTGTVAGPLVALGAHKMGLLSFASTGLAMYLGSLLKSKIKSKKL